MIMDAFPEGSAFAGGHSAYRALHFGDYLRLLAISPIKPELLVLPLNMRTLSPQWNRHPNYALQSHRRILNHLICAGLGLSPVSVRCTEDPPQIQIQRFWDIQLENPLGELTRIGDLEALRDNTRLKTANDERRRREIFIYHYAMPLPVDCGETDTWCEMVAFAAKYEIKLLVYATPINVSAGTELIGPAFSKAVRDKVAFFEKRVFETVSSKFFRFVDLHDASPPSHFFHRELASEHLNQAGREYVSRQLRDQITRFIVP